jgi:hypothetical protein
MSDQPAQQSAEKAWRDCGAPWVPVQRGECARCGSDVGPATGLDNRFRVERLTPSSRGIDHADCRYFVLDPQHDPDAREALYAYSRLARQRGRFGLADDLDLWVHRLNEAERCPECGVHRNANPPDNPGIPHSPTCTRIPPGTPTPTSLEESP